MRTDDDRERHRRSRSKSSARSAARVARRATCRSAHGRTRRLPRGAGCAAAGPVGRRALAPAQGVRRRVRGHHAARGVRRSGAHRARTSARSARRRRATTPIPGRRTSRASGAMLAHASPDFLRRHIPKMLSGEDVWVQFFSEPSAGSDLAGVQTRADRDGDRWILNGAKIWSTGAAFADYGMCLARTNWDVPKHQGLTWFAVRCDAPGVTVQPIREISGGEDFCQEFFDDVELSDDDVIGEVNNGLGRHPDDAHLRARRGAGQWWLSGGGLVGDATGPAHARTRPRRARASGSVASRTRRSASSSPVPTSTTSPAPNSVGGSASSSRRAANPAGTASYGKLASGHARPDPRPDRGRGRSHRGAALGARRRRRDVGVAQLPERPDHVDRRRHQRDPAQRHRRACARLATRAELRQQQAVPSRWSPRPPTGRARSGDPRVAPGSSTRGSVRAA